MEIKAKELAIGSLLHDVGKLLYRYNDGRSHSVSGYEFLKEQGIENKAILNQVRYHHGKQLSQAELSQDDLAYVTYWADNVAAGADRRKNDDSDAWGYDKYVPLSSIFNILNGNTQDYAYNLEMISDYGKANEPAKSVTAYAEGNYQQIIENIKNCLSAIELTDAYVNSLLCILEATESFVPSSTDKSQLCDISLYDHSKITAAVAACIFEYMQENDIEDFNAYLFKNAESAYKEKAFMLMSMDISGIQDFIYTVGTENVLKTLRAKSFYLEIMLEHIIDELLEETGVSRANLIYSGGGHAYLLLANTEKTKTIIRKFKNELNRWFLKWFKTDLYIAFGMTECSAEDLMNKPEGSYSDMFRRVSESISDEKAARYSADEIRSLNSQTHEQYGRECRICGNLDDLNTNNLCSMCEAFIGISQNILEKNFVTILSEKPEGVSLRMPFEKWMILENEDELRTRIKDKQAAYVRSYSKNRMFTGYNVANKLWIGDYHKGNSFSSFVREAEGIKRIGVLRADVDNLGQAFVRGFEKKDGSQKYVSLSRSATFSRKMSLFFKLHLNDILKNGSFSFTECSGESKGSIARNAAIIYSGGDDLFIIGAWDDVLEAAVDIHDRLESFTQGTLKISAGFGIYPEKYPASALARQTGELEEAAKDMPGKNAIALFDDSSVYHWDDFIDGVAGEKFRMIKKYFDGNEEKGASAMYKMLNFIRSREEKINLARLAYLLGRMEPDAKASEEKKSLYREFSQKMYKWIKDETESRELVTAIYIYVYLNRKKEGNHAGTDEN